MFTHVKSGYDNIFKPPFEMVSRSTIYCIASSENNFLIIVPLVPAFFNDAVRIIKKSNYKKIYVVMSDVGTDYISDYSNLYNFVTYTMRRQMIFFSKYLPQAIIADSFNAAIHRPANGEVINIPVETNSISIQFLHTNIINAPYACSVIIGDTYNRKLFVNHVDENMLLFLSTDPLLKYDEAHIPYQGSNYLHNIPYEDIIIEHPEIKDYLKCNLFINDSEYRNAISHGVKIGEVFSYDPV